MVQCLAPGTGVQTSTDTQKAMYDYEEIVNYQCANSDASVVQGNLSIHCMSTGEWSDSPPVCGE